MGSSQRARTDGKESVDLPDSHPSIHGPHEFARRTTSADLTDTNDECLSALQQPRPRVRTRTLPNLIRRHHERLSQGAVAIHIIWAAEKDATAAEQPLSALMSQSESASLDDADLQSVCCS